MLVLEGLTMFVTPLQVEAAASLKVQVLCVHGESNQSQLGYRTSNSPNVFIRWRAYSGAPTKAPQYSSEKGVSEK